ncbi:hypothetical protein E2C01_003963 [Portunus trituberculatus]|uniref:Uncharacterized protein n=1 Tax=Portunus trituberculatus TaxID=210409 RepID=A0A5B7CP95_PORTR|nr:hypothetical protein [Portunus trituberculatus]
MYPATAIVISVTAQLTNLCCGGEVREVTGSGAAESQRHGGRRLLVYCRVCCWCHCRPSPVWPAPPRNGHNNIASILSQPIYNIK